MNCKSDKWVQLIIAILLSFSSGIAQVRQAPKKTAPARPAPFLQQAKSYEETPYVTKVVLKNGMTVLVNEFRPQPVVSIRAYVGTGFLDEPAKSPGIARLVAAMVCRGSPDKIKGSLRQNVQALGGLLNCSTDYQNTVFEIVAPSSQWKRALSVQADSLSNPVFAQEAISLEAALLAGEAAGAMDDPRKFASAKLLELGFDQPRMNPWAGLTRASLLNLKPEDLSAFHKAAYSPERIMLVIAGDVSSSEVLNELVRIYDQKPAPGALRPSPSFIPRAPGSFRYARMAGASAMPQLLFGFQTVPGNSREFPAVKVLSAILGMGENSILAARLRDRKQLILEEEINLTAYPNFGYLTIRLTVQPEDIDRAEIAALTELELLKREEPDAAEMERAFAQLERAFWTSLDCVTGRALALAHFQSLGDWKLKDRYVSDLRQVKPGDVMRAASKYLRLENCSLIEVLPAGAEDRKLTTEGIRNTLEGLIAPSAEQEKLERDKETVLAVNIPPSAGSFKFNEIRYPFITASILRGPDMYVREDHTSPLIDMGIFLPGGIPDEDEGNSGITNLMARLMLRGAKDQSASQFLRQMEVYGGQVQPVIAPDYFGLHFSILSRNFEPGLKLLLESIRNPAFDNEEIILQKRIQSAKIRNRADSIDGVQELMNQTLFRNSHYSSSIDGSEGSLAAITPAAIQSWYESHVKNRKPIVIAIGDTQGASLASYFVRPFSGARMQNARIPEEFAQPVEKPESLDRGWDRSHSLILVGFQAPPEDDVDGNAAAVLESFAGDPGRFVQELRDRLGLAFKVALTYDAQLRGGSMVLRAATAPGNEDALLKAVQEEIRHIREDPIPYREYRSAVNAAAGAYWIRSQARFQQIPDILKKLLAGKGMDAYQNVPAGIQEVQEEDLKEVAQRILNMNKAVILRMKGRSGINP
jgi:zinc protease